MNTLFKKHFWIVGLVGAALLALAVAGIASVLIGARFFALPTAPAFAEAGGEAAPETHGRLATDVDAVTDFAKRRIFTADWPDAMKPAPAPAEDTPAEKPEGEAAPADTLEPTKLPISLLGTFVAEDAAYSFADLVVQGENKIASVGSAYLDGQATVIRIARGLVLFKEASGFTYARIWDAREQTAAAGVAPPGDAAYRPPGAPPGPGAGPGRPAPTGLTGTDDSGGDEGGAGVTKTGAYDYQVSRSMIDKELADPAKLQREARAVPHFKDNQYGGVKLVGVRPGSLYRTIGIRSGDIITGVNGTRIDNPGKALELIEQLRKSTNITVDIERRGQPRQLNYTIQ
jgi:type II secretion system protein C